MTSTSVNHFVAGGRRQVTGMVLTQLYVPADRRDRARKALAGEADVVILDLEDAVAVAAKEQARAAVPALVDEYPGCAVMVRVNAPGTPWGPEDLKMVSSLPAAFAPEPEEVERTRRR